MPLPEAITRETLALMTDCPVDWLARWSQDGTLQPLGAGIQGAHRQFRLHDVLIAGVLVPLANAGIKREVQRDVARYVRDSLRKGQRGAAAFKNIMDGRQAYLWMVYFPKDGGWRLMLNTRRNPKDDAEKKLLEGAELTLILDLRRTWGAAAVWQAEQMKAMGR